MAGKGCDTLLGRRANHVAAGVPVELQCVSPSSDYPASVMCVAVLLAVSRLVAKYHTCSRNHHTLAPFRHVRYPKVHVDTTLLLF